MISFESSTEGHCLQLSEAEMEETNIEGTILRYVQGNIIGQLIAIMGDIGAINKDKSGTGISYKFRGIDQVTEKWQPLLVKHKVLVLPTGTREVSFSERETKNGGVLNYCRLIQRYTFFSGTDNSLVECEIPGEAMDNGD